MIRRRRNLLADKRIAPRIFVVMGIVLFLSVALIVYRYANKEKEFPSIAITHNLIALNAAGKATGGIPPYRYQWYGALEVADMDALDGDKGRSAYDRVYALGTDVTQNIVGKPGDVFWPGCLITDSGTPAVSQELRRPLVEIPWSEFPVNRPPIRPGYQKILLFFMGDSITASGMGFSSRKAFPGSGSPALQSEFDDLDPDNPRFVGRDGQYPILKDWLIERGYKVPEVKMRVLAWYGMALGRDLRAASKTYQGNMGTIAYQRNERNIPTENALGAILRVIDREVAANPTYKPIIVLNIGMNDALSYGLNDKIGTLTGREAIQQAIEDIEAAVVTKRGFDLVYNTSSVLCEDGRSAKELLLNTGGGKAKYLLFPNGFYRLYPPLVPVSHGRMERRQNMARRFRLVCLLGRSPSSVR